MLKKILILGVLGLIVVSAVSFGSVFAKNDEQEDSLLPEKEGIYDVPGRPDLKVRVFVHNPRPAKPVSSPSLICNLPDPDSTALVGATGWRLPAGTWTYTLNPSSVPSSVGSANLAIMSADAFDRWSVATGTSATSDKVIFVKTSSNTTVSRKALDGKNIIAWGRTSGTALAVTYIWYYPSTGLVAEVDTIMNKKFSWSWSNPAVTPNCADSNTYDAQDILTHELGHWLGLNDMYDAANYQNATMYGYGSKGEVKKDTLSSGDILRVRAIYP